MQEGTESQGDRGRERESLCQPQQRPRREADRQTTNERRVRCLREVKEQNKDAAAGSGAGAGSGIGRGEQRQSTDSWWGRRKKCGRRRAHGQKQSSSHECRPIRTGELRKGSERVTARRRHASPSRTAQPREGGWRSRPGRRPAHEAAVTRGDSPGRRHQMGWTTRGFRAS